MSEKNIIDKLRILLPHWIEHNNNHLAEFRKWESKARAESGKGISISLEKAIRNMEEAGKSLSEALEKVGGPLESDEGRRHHH